MARLRIIVDTSQVAALADELRRASEVGFRRVVERAEQLLRTEAPKVTGNLRQGVSSDVEITPTGATADLIVSARRARRGARQALLHQPDGTTRTIRLRAQAAFDYAEVVARGRGAIHPKKARALLIPVGAPLQHEAYIEAGGQFFIVRRSARAVPANPYDERAARKLEGEIETIMTAQLDKVLDAQ
jgi:hypothetical protein